MNKFEQLLDDDDLLFVITDPTKNTSQINKPKGNDETKEAQIKSNKSNSSNKFPTHKMSNLRIKCEDLFLEGPNRYDYNLCCCKESSEKLSSISEKCSKKLQKSSESLTKLFWGVNTKMPPKFINFPCVNCGYVDKKFEKQNIKKAPTAAEEPASIKKKSRKPPIKKYKLPSSPRTKKLTCTCPPNVHATLIRGTPHKNCNENNFNIPSHMGFNWLASGKQLPKGWRPGAIPKSIKGIMHHFLQPSFPCDNLSCTRKPRRQNDDNEIIGDSKEKNNKQLKSLKDIPNAEVEEPMPPPLRPPTLHIQRDENGEYIIKMQPIKDVATLKFEPNESPYYDCKPITVKITNNDTEMINLCEIRRLVISDYNFKKCKCQKLVANCKCFDNREMDKLKKCLNKLSKEYEIEDLANKLTLCWPNKLDIQFTPAAGNIDLSKLPTLRMQETQYDENDLTGVVSSSNGNQNGGANIDSKQSPKGNDKETNKSVKDGKNGKNNKEKDSKDDKEALNTNGTTKTGKSKKK